MTRYPIGERIKVNYDRDALEVIYFALQVWRPTFGDAERLVVTPTDLSPDYSDGPRGVREYIHSDIALDFDSDNRASLIGMQFNGFESDGTLFRRYQSRPQFNKGPLSDDNLSLLSRFEGYPISFTVRMFRTNDQSVRTTGDDGFTRPESIDQSWLFWGNRSGWNTTFTDAAGHLIWTGDNNLWSQEAAFQRIQNADGDIPFIPAPEGVITAWIGGPSVDGNRIQLVDSDGGYFNYADAIAAFNLPDVSNNNLLELNQANADNSLFVNAVRNVFVIRNPGRVDSTGITQPDIVPSTLLEGELPTRDFIHPFSAFSDARGELTFGQSFFANVISSDVTPESIDEITDLEIEPSEHILVLDVDDRDAIEGLQDTPSFIKRVDVPVFRIDGNDFYLRDMSEGFGRRITITLTSRRAA